MTSYGKVLVLGLIVGGLAGMFVKYCHFTYGGGVPVMRAGVSDYLRKT